jgi:UDP-glucose 4-epimerase
VRELAEIIAGLCDTRLVVRQSAPRHGDIRVSIGDPSRAIAELDFRARTPLPNGLAMTLQALGGDIDADAEIAA